jgi:hypothetical protein
MRNTRDRRDVIRLPQQQQHNHDWRHDAVTALLQEMRTVIDAGEMSDERWIECRDLGSLLLRRHPQSPMTREVLR